MNETPMDSPEVHPVHAHATGHRWFDYAIGATALLVSVVSLYVALHHGRTMEKLVQANSFPNVESDFSIRDDAPSGGVLLQLTLRNTGVGPARIETLAMSAGGVPLASLGDLVSTLTAAAQQDNFSARVGIESVVGSLIGAGRQTHLLQAQFDDAAIWFKPVLSTANKIEMQVCYCSVFDECFMVRTGQRAVSVKQCVKPAVPYNDRSKEMLQHNPVAAPAASAVAR